MSVIWSVIMVLTHVLVGALFYVAGLRDGQK
jgi:hypothetical protein